MIGNGKSWDKYTTFNYKLMKTAPTSVVWSKTFSLLNALYFYIMLVVYKHFTFLKVIKEYYQIIKIK